MPHTVTIEKTLFAFSELSERAKENAREWFREGNLDHEWWDSVYDDADRVATILGIEMDRKTVRQMDGKTRSGGPTIWFSGFCSQGDGACFEGRYSYSKGAAKEIRKYAPQDTELHALADSLQQLQRKNFYNVEARVKHRGHYYHSLCTEIDVGNRHGQDVSAETEEETKQLLRDFMHWVYKRLEAEHDYLQSNESVDESIEANEYEFTEDGRIA